METAAIAKLKPFAHLVQVETGTIIFEEAAWADSVYLIERGHVKFYHNASSGKISLLSIRGPGDLFGIAAVLLEKRRSVFAETLSPCQLWRMEGRTFIQLLQADPLLSLQVAVIHSQYLREAEITMGHLLSLEVDHRLAWLLKKLSSRISTPQGEKLRITVRLTHQDMASMVGTCRQTVTTVLGKFKKAGIIYVNKQEQWIDIVDSDKFHQYVD